MIVPSIDLMNGRAVQLRQGKELILDGGDPLARLEEFSVAGEVAVVDLDAALGRGSNGPLIKEMVRAAPCRVGGGIRNVSAAREWLDAGAEKVMVGTAASIELCEQLPRDRVMAALDAERGEVVVDGWRTRTGRSVVERIRELAPYVGGFLLTQVEHEGGLAGFDHVAVEQAVAAAAGVRITAAGGITTPADVGELDSVGVDAQVGMALYTGRLTLSDALVACLRRPAAGDIWPTVVCDRGGRALGLVWSNRESLGRALQERRGIYWSRSRQELWIKGASSGNIQSLDRVEVDCDRDALRFVVEQHGSGFCHLGTPSCWGSDFSLDALANVLQRRATSADPESGTAALFRNPALLAAKLAEEAGELATADTREAAIHEAADVLYFALVALVRQGGSVHQVLQELERRHRRVSRRPMRPKPSPPVAT